MKKNFFILVLIANFFWPCLVNAQMSGSQFSIESDEISAISGNSSSTHFQEIGYNNGFGLGNASSPYYDAYFGFLTDHELFRLSFNCDKNSYKIPAIIGYGYATLNKDDALKCQVIADNPTGYEIAINSSASAKLVNSNNQGFDSLTTKGWDNDLQKAYWGVLADSNNPEYSQDKWLGPLPTAQRLAGQSYSTDASGKEHYFQLGAYAGSNVSLPADIYRNDLTLTLTAL